MVQVDDEFTMISKTPNLNPDTNNNSNIYSYLMLNKHAILSQD